MILLLAMLACAPTSLRPRADGALCEEASETMGSLACLHEVPNQDTFHLLQRPSDAVDKVGETKWLAPARTDARLDETLFLAMSTVQLHWELMAQGFPDRFPTMSHQEYSRLVLDPEVKEFYSGNLTLYEDGRLGFTLWSGTDPALVPTADLIESLWRDLSSRVPFAELAFVPNSELQRDALTSWGDVPFPVRFPEDDVLYEAYTPGTGYGTVRRYTPEELLEAEEEVSFGPTDILVLAEAPFDLERPIAGAVTGSRQGELSHLNVRSAARGTPNCYLRDAYDTLASYEGRLVRIDCGESRLDIDDADPEAAEDWWAEIRPEPVVVPLPDLSDQPLMPLLDLPTDTVEERTAGVSAYGSKGANLATLYQRIDPDLQLDGFLIPMAPFHRHLVDAGLDGEAVRIAQDPELQTDSAARRVELLALQDAVESAPVDADLVADLVLQIHDTFGDTNVMVRFRSSSNAEDALGFSGAGLYDSTSVCAADSLDDDDDGPSLCDPDQEDERTVERGLRKVWASVYGVPAWEERLWYGIEPTDVAMGILVDTRAKDEQVNAVAFTGNPVLEDDRFLINAQVGWLDVVSAEGGVVPEQILATVEGDGVELERVRPSSVAGEILIDSDAEALARALAHIQIVYPVDEPAPPDTAVLLDTEWKVLEDGRLIVKQVRPFLRRDDLSLR